MNILEEANRLKRILDTFRPLSKEDELRIMQKFRLDWNYHSNHIEGNSLSYGETKALILFHITAQGKPLKDHIEVEGHNDAINLIIDVIKQKRPLTEVFIRNLHEILLKQPYYVNAITSDGKPTKKLILIGNYKKTPNHVKTTTGEIFRFATVEETPSKMFDLLNWYHNKIKSQQISPILIASEFHYKFIRIHPFDDGNGRLARILMNFILMQFGYPPVIIKTEDKERYYTVLRLADAGNIHPFIEYITSNLIQSLKLMIKGAKGENIEEPDDVEKEVTLLEQKLNSVSKPLKQKIYTKKNINNLNELFKQFIIKINAFDKLYKKTAIDFSIDGVSYKQLQNLTENKQYKEVRLKKTYGLLNNKKIKLNSFISSIRVVFKEYEYFVYLNEKKEFSKYYDEPLTKNNIDLLINKETKRHSSFLKNLIEKFNSPS